MTAFLRLELATRREADQQTTPVLINVDQITRILPAWPSGATVILAEPPDGVGLHVSASLDEIQSALYMTHGSIFVRDVARHTAEQEAQRWPRRDAGA